MGILLGLKKLLLLLIPTNQVKLIEKNSGSLPMLSLSISISAILLPMLSIIKEDVLIKKWLLKDSRLLTLTMMDHSHMMKLRKALSNLLLLKTTPSQLRNGLGLR